MRSTMSNASPQRYPHAPTRPILWCATLFSRTEHTTPLAHHGQWVRATADDALIYLLLSTAASRKRLVVG